MSGESKLGSGPAFGSRARPALPRDERPPAAAAMDTSLTGGERDALAAPAEATVAAGDDGGGAALPAPALRMLYVEDDRINAILFEESLRSRGGIELQVTETGAEALALVQHWQPEVLVLDANLPDMSGYDLLARLRQQPALARVPAFMCSADATDEDLRRAAAAGFIGYWTKPIDIVRVMADLDRLQTSDPAG